MATKITCDKCNRDCTADGVTKLVEKYDSMELCRSCLKLFEKGLDEIIERIDNQRTDAINSWFRDWKHSK